MQRLADVFAIDLCAYAVMSNHYHVVLRLSTRHLHWSASEVVERWGRIFRVPDFLETMNPHLRAVLIEKWRIRLGSISWFMKCLNEPLARLANKEDQCTGRFWEGRFRSQALLDEDALIKCMAYVDLNPVRAKIAKTPEDSSHTSIQARIQGRAQLLAPMYGDPKATQCLPISFNEYLAVVDWTGRQIQAGKRGAIDASVAPIFQRLGVVDATEWFTELRKLRSRYLRAIGGQAALLRHRESLGLQRLNGLTG